MLQHMAKSYNNQNLAFLNRRPGVRIPPGVPDNPHIMKVCGFCFLA